MKKLTEKDHLDIRKKHQVDECSFISLAQEYGVDEDYIKGIVLKNTMFVFSEYTNDVKRRKEIDHNGQTVRFMKYADMLVVNLNDYIPLVDEKNHKILKGLLPRKWRDDLGKVWMNVEHFNKLIENMRKK